MFYHWATEVEQDGLTWWIISEKEPRKGKRMRELSTPDHYRGRLSAFTVAELGNILPEKIHSLDEVGFYREKIVDIPTSRYEVFYADAFDGHMIEPKLVTGSIRAANEADARHAYSSTSSNKNF